MQKSNIFFKMVDDETNIDSFLCVISQEPEDTDGLRECSLRIPKSLEYGTLFGLTLSVSYLDTFTC